MTQVLDNAEVADSARRFWLTETAATLDAAAVLSAALAPKWSVQREVDYVGEVSIILLPAHDHPTIEHRALPSFILFEKDGQARVATVTEDQWVADQGFRDIQPAVTAIIAAAAAISTSHQHAG